MAYPQMQGDMLAMDSECLAIWTDDGGFRPCPKTRFPPANENGSVSMSMVTY